MLWDHAWSSGEMMGRVLDDLPVAAAVLGPDRVVVYVNRQFESFTRRLRGDVLGQDLTFLWGSDSDGELLREVDAAFEAGLPFRDVVYSYRDDGVGFWNRLALTPVRDRHGLVSSFMALMEDVTEEVAERRAGLEHAQTGRMLIGAAAAFGEARDRPAVAAALAGAVVDGGALWAGVIAESPGGGFRVDGVASASDFGLDAPMPLGSVVERNLGLEQALETERPWIVDPASAPPHLLDWMLRTGVRHVLMTALPKGSAARAIILAVSRQTDQIDATALDRMGRLAELGAIALQNVLLVERLGSMAERDQLTGATSRAAFQRRLEGALDTASGEVGLVYVDVDRFKQVNDSLGHTGGDAVLAQLFDRVAGAVDGDTVVGRTGGDEFILLVEGTEVRRRIETLMEWIGQISFDPFDIDGRPVHVGCSAGAAVGRRRSGETSGQAATRLIRQADENMYVTKRRKRDWRRLDTDLDVVQLEAGLHRAVERDEIATQYQPQFHATTGRLTGFEALARWNHPSFGPVPPDVFIPLADETGLIDSIGDRILQQAFAFAERVSSRGAIQMSVNLSGRQMFGARFAVRFDELLSVYPHRTWAVTVEIAEADLADDPVGMQRLIRALRAMGVDIAIDNFGIGQSSLALLGDLPVTAIKIDKSFVHRVGALGGGMIGAIVNLARGLGVGVMAEGVDQNEQFAVLQRFGCDRLQGHLLAPPMDPDDAMATPLFVPLAKLGGIQLRRVPSDRRFG